LIPKGNIGERRAFCLLAAEATGKRNHSFFTLSLNLTKWSRFHRVRKGIASWIFVSIQQPSAQIGRFIKNHHEVSFA